MVTSGKLLEKMETSVMTKSKRYSTHWMTSLRVSPRLALLLTPNCQIVCCALTGGGGAMELDQFGGQLGRWCWTDHTDKILASGSVAGRSPVFLTELSEIFNTFF